MNITGKMENDLLYENVQSDQKDSKYSNMNIFLTAMLCIALIYGGYFGRKYGISSFFITLVALTSSGA